MTTLDPVDVGDHVCWMVDPGEDTTGPTRAFVADGELFGDMVLLLGESDGERRGPASWESLFNEVSRGTERADREGFRTLRVLADLSGLPADDTRPEIVARHELRLDALAADRGTILVCVYARAALTPEAIDQAVGVHPHHLGAGPVAPSFRLFSSAGDRWSVSGVVDTEGAASFRTALGELVARVPVLHLDCAGLEFMDSTGLTALAQVARGRQDRRIELRHANETLRRSWSLLGFEHPEIPVELMQ
ncbi:MEDS domain-containing protein [Kitasatospora sp. MBT63]|uniref:MEDS domain-containing protein n=1 Tax=Kitasatospora sp. MBT63 TaxID=1444768 RepID=UPI000689F22F|nr:MEDS domain-containing protein [Kitasatospora sp. MBT63]